MRHRPSFRVLVLSLLSWPVVHAQNVGPVDVAILANGENVYAPYPFQKGIAATRDGALYALSQFNTTAGTALRVYRSTDGGLTFQPETTARLPISGLGSVVTGTDGHTLHLAWQISINGVGSVAYGTYDSRTRLWLGQDQVLFQGGATANDGYHWPNLDVGPDGNPIVTCTTHRNRAWSGQMRIFDGTSWSAERQINVDTYGVFVSVVADENGDFHFAYRTNSGGYGIRYRRWDRAAGTWGAEGEVPVFAGTANVSALVVDDQGNKHVVYTKASSLEIATAGPGSFTFVSQPVAADGYGIGNVNFFNFALTEIPAGVAIVYSYFNRTYDEVFVRLLSNGSLSPEASLFRIAGQKYELLSGHARVRHRVNACALFTAEDPVAGVRSLLAWGEPIAAFVPFGSGCAGQGGFVPTIGATQPPMLNRLGFALLLERARPQTAALLMLGYRDDRWGAVGLPLDLTPAGLTGCALRVAPLVFATAATAGTNPGEGTAQVGLAFPNDPSLVGARVIGQWLVVDGGANPAGLVASDGGAAILR